jgi:hypothetical protein
MEGAHETGVMFVSNRVGNLFDGQLARGKQQGRFLQPLFADQTAYSEARCLLEQSLQMRGAKMNLKREIAHRAGRLGMDYREDFAQTPFSDLRF